MLFSLPKNNPYLENQTGSWYEKVNYIAEHELPVHGWFEDQYYEAMIRTHGGNTAKEARTHGGNTKVKK